MHIIETKDLSYSYDDGTQALKRLNISIARNKTTAIIGGNGSGKSTLFLHLNGILKPTSGMINYEGKPIVYNKKSLFDLRKNVGIVFQNPQEQLFSANVRKDIIFGMKNINLPDDEISKRLDEIMKRTGVIEFADKPTHALSYGQQKRVAIAGVLAMKPSLMILDEPTAGLDPEGVSDILKLIREIQETDGITVVLSTHEIDLISLYCDAVYVLSKGESVFFGTTEELWRNPELLRKHHLRLPRISHLMEILSKHDGWDVNLSAATIGEARKALKDYVGEIPEA